MPKGKVSQVKDGDTFKISRGPWIRLEGVNAPEIGKKGSAKARDELKDMIGSKTVIYEPVGKSYGRTVAKVKVGGKSVNTAMKRKGYK